MDNWTYDSLLAQVPSSQQTPYTYTPCHMLQAHSEPLSPSQPAHMLASYSFTNRVAQMLDVSRDAPVVQIAHSIRNQRDIQPQLHSAQNPDLLLEPSRLTQHDLNRTNTITHFFSQVDGHHTISEIAQFAVSLRSRLKIDMVLQSLIATLETEVRRMTQSDDDQFYWAKRFLEAQHLEEGPTRYATLSRLADDFRTFSVHYAETLVHEMGLPDRLRSIRPVSIGGVAGGDKYVTCSMLFKLPHDTCVSEGIYLYAGEAEDGNDEFAMKAAARELLAANEYSMYLPEGYTVPMQCIVDFIGFRIISMPLLPVQRDTIVYGSNDAMYHVHWTADVHRVLMEVAHRLHLASHLVKGYTDDEARTLCTAGDVEVHLGFDENYYMLDLARVFPPLDPVSCNIFAGLRLHANSVFYRLMRPEFLRLLNDKDVYSLSSDALSAWGAIDAEFHNSNAVTATEELVCIQVDELAQYLDENKDEIDSFSVLFHRNGLNLSLLGAVMKKCRNLSCKVDLALEMICRSFKNCLRKKWRESRSAKEEWISPYLAKIATVNFLNSLCSGDQNCLLFEEVQQRLLQQYGCDILPYENLCDVINLNIEKIVFRLLQDCQIRLSAECISAFSDIVIGFHFSVADIEMFESYTASLTLLKLTQVQHLLERSILLEDFSLNQHRHFYIASSKSNGIEIEALPKRQYYLLAAFSHDVFEEITELSPDLPLRFVVLSCLTRVLYEEDFVRKFPRALFSYTIDIWDMEVYFLVANVLACCALYLESNPGSWGDIIDEDVANVLVNKCIEILRTELLRNLRNTDKSMAAAMIVSACSFVDGFTNLDCCKSLIKISSQLRRGLDSLGLERIPKMLEYKCRNFFTERPARREAAIWDSDSLPLHDLLFGKHNFDFVIRNLRLGKVRCCIDQDFPAGLFYNSLLTFYLRCNILDQSLSCENWNCSQNTLTALTKVCTYWDHRDHANLFDIILYGDRDDDRRNLVVDFASDTVPEYLDSIAMNCVKKGIIDGRLNFFTSKEDLVNYLCKTTQNPDMFHDILFKLGNLNKDNLAEGFLVLCRREFEEAVSLFLDYGVSVNCRDESGFSGLEVVIGNENFQLASKLLQMDISDLTLPLHTACLQGLNDFITLLVDHGADVNSTDTEGLISLHLACRKGHLDSLKLLIEYGADITTCAVDGCTPLNEARRNGYRELSDYILSIGGDMKAADAYDKKQSERMESDGIRMMMSGFGAMKPRLIWIDVDKFRLMWGREKPEGFVQMGSIPLRMIEGIHLHPQNPLQMKLKYFSSNPFRLIARNHADQLDFLNAIAYAQLKH